MRSSRRLTQGWACSSRILAGLRRCLLLRRASPAAEAVMIGDRAERDGLCARRAGVRALLRASKPVEGWQTFKRYDDPLFAPFLASPG